MTSAHRVRLFAAARSAAGVGEITITASSTQELCAELTSRFGPEFEQVLSQSSLLVAGRVMPYPEPGSDSDAPEESPLPAGVPVDVLPPFAGG